MFKKKIMANQFLFAIPGGMEWILVAFGLALFVFWIKMIVEIATSDFQDDSSKIVWLLVTILLGFLGALVYYFAGRSGRLLKAS